MFFFPMMPFGNNPTCWDRNNRDVGSRDTTRPFTRLFDPEGGAQAGAATTGSSRWVGGWWFTREDTHTHSAFGAETGFLLRQVDQQQSRDPAGPARGSVHSPPPSENTLKASWTVTVAGWPNVSTQTRLTEHRSPRWCLPGQVEEEVWRSRKAPPVLEASPLSGRFHKHT